MSFLSPPFFFFDLTRPACLFVGFSVTRCVWKQCSYCIVTTISSRSKSSLKPSNELPLGHYLMVALPFTSSSAENAAAHLLEYLRMVRAVGIYIYTVAYFWRIFWLTDPRCYDVFLRRVSGRLWPHHRTRHPCTISRCRLNFSRRNDSF